MSDRESKKKNKKRNKKNAATQYLDLEAKRHKGRDYESDGDNQDEYEDDGFLEDDLNKEIYTDKKTGKKIKKSGYYLKANVNALKAANKEDKKAREIKIMLLMEGMKYSRKLATNAYIAGCKSVEELQEKEARVDAEDSDDSGESEDEDEEAEDSSNEIIDVDPVAIAKAEAEEVKLPTEECVMYQGKAIRKYFLHKELEQYNNNNEKNLTSDEIQEVLDALNGPVVEKVDLTANTSSSSSSSDNPDEIESSSSSSSSEEEESVDEGDVHREADALKDQAEDETIEQLLEEKKAREARRVLDSDSESAHDHGNTAVYTTNDSSSDDEDDGKLRLGYNGNKKVKNQPFDPEKAIYKQDGNFEFKSKYYKITYHSLVPIPADLTQVNTDNYSTARIESGSMAGQYATFVLKDLGKPYYVGAKKGLLWEKKFTVEEQKKRLELSKKLNNIYGTDVVPDPTQTRCIIAQSLFDSKKKKWDESKQSGDLFTNQLNAALDSSKMNKKKKKQKTSIIIAPLTLVPVKPPIPIVIPIIGKPATIELKRPEVKKVLPPLIKPSIPMPITGKPATIELKKPEAKKEPPYKSATARPAPLVQQQLFLSKNPSVVANNLPLAPTQTPALQVPVQTIDANGKPACTQCCGQHIEMNQIILKRKFTNHLQPFVLDSDQVGGENDSVVAAHFTHNSVQSILLKGYNNYLNASTNQTLLNEMTDVKNTWDACLDYAKQKKVGTTYGYGRTIIGPKVLTSIIKHLPFFDPEARNLLFERMKKQKT